MKKLTRLWGAIALVGIMAVAGAACGSASSGDIDSVRADVTAIQQTVESVSSDLEDIGRRLGALETLAGQLPSSGGDTGSSTPPVTAPVGDYIHGTFDTSDQIQENLLNGVTTVSVNQQQPLQGYLSILSLALYQRVGVSPPSSVTLTGPHLVTSENAATAPTRDGIQSIKDDPSQLNFVAVQHARCAWDTFWCTVEAGIELAAEDAGVQVQILGPDGPGVENQAQLIDQAVATNPDGIIVTFPNEGLRASIERAVAADIPVIVYNSSLTGSPSGDGVDYLTFLGQDETEGGIQAGHRLAEAAGPGSHSAVCINHQVGNTSLDQRCEGFKTALAKDGITDFAVVETTEDSASSQQTLSTYFAANPNVDIFLTLGPLGATPFYSFIEDSNLDDSDFTHGTFDFDDQIAENISSGRTEFGIDQQPFLQGYGALTWLYLINLYRVFPPDEVTLTGPGFITADTVDSIPSGPDGYRTAWETPLNLAAVHHGSPGNTWWETMNETIRLASRNIGVETTISFISATNFDEYTNLVSQVRAAQPDGLAVTLPNPSAIKESLDAVIADKIPVVGFNASDGGPAVDDIAYLTYIGQDEYQGGLQGGALVASIAPSGSKAVCVNHEVGHIGLDARCRGVMDAMRNAGIPLAGSGVLEVSNDVSASAQVISTFLTANPDVNILFTLGPPPAEAFYAFLEDR